MENKHFTIKSWARGDRPREKLIELGKSKLTDAELVAILIGSGTPRVSALDLSKQIMAGSNNDLNQLASLSIPDLMKFKGIGLAKAITIVSALELSNRRRLHEIGENPKITSASDVFQLFTKELMDLDHEEFWILLLKRNNEVIRKTQISKGGISGTFVDPKIIFNHAIENMTSALILIHNHPSGNLKPSNEDIKLTRKISEAAKTLDINLLDHLIFTNAGYFSFADENLL